MVAKVAFEDKFLFFEAKIWKKEEVCLWQADDFLQICSRKTEIYTKSGLLRPSLIHIYYTIFLSKRLGLWAVYMV